MKYVVRRAITEAKNKFWAEKLADMTIQEAYGQVKRLSPKAAYPGTVRDNKGEVHSDDQAIAGAIAESRREICKINEGVIP